MNNQSTTPQRLEQFTLISTGGCIRFGRVEVTETELTKTEEVQLELDLVMTDSEILSTDVTRGQLTSSFQKSD